MRLIRQFRYILFAKYVIIGFILLFFLNILFAKQNIIEKSAGGVVLVYIPPGSFVMGQNSEDKDYSPQHNVEISSGFWMGKYEITQKQYFDIAGVNPCEGSKYGEGDNLPVYNISWYEAVLFCNKLSNKNKLEPYYIINTTRKDKDNISNFDDIKWSVRINEKANGFRLPTEAQWEYGYRAGTKTKYYWGDNSSYDTVGQYSWHLFNSGSTNYYNGNFRCVKNHKVRKVGSKIQNKFGLYDMNGNVSEWCFDRYNKNSYSGKASADPIGSQDKYIYRVARGGSILDSPSDFTFYKRWPVEAFEKTGVIGLRVVLPE